jgi:hypothetical protein
MQSAQHAPQPEPTPAPAGAFDINSILSEDERKEWGEVLPVIEKVARGMVAPLQQELQSRIGQVNQQVENVQSRVVLNDRQKMLSTLDDPNNQINKTGRPFGPDGGSTWRDINRDDEFVGWLQYPDPLSGQKRHDMLNEAFQANDASRVAAFFANFLREVAAVAPQAQPQPGSAPNPQGNGAAPPLEAYAAPGRARTAAPPSGPAETVEIITTGDVSQFFAQKVAGKFKGRESEAEAFEKKIFAAENAGRLLPGPPQRR